LKKKKTQSFLREGSRKTKILGSKGRDQPDHRIQREAHRLNGEMAGRSDYNWITQIDLDGKNFGVKRFKCCM